MASCQSIIAKKTLEKDDPFVLLHQDILELSKQINGMAVVVRNAGKVGRQTSSDADALAAYANLALSLEKLTQAFETLHRYGSIVLTLDHNNKAPKPN